MFGMTTASQFLHSGAYKTALVIGGDVLSRWVRPQCNSFAVLYPYFQ